MRSKIALLAIAGLAFFMSGCSIYSARFSPPVKQETNVVLRENDFEYVERNIEGSYGYWSIHLFLFLEIPLGDPRLFSNALADLYMQSQEQAEGQPSQLMNWTLDSTQLWIPIPYITPVHKQARFRADLIEYTK